MKVIAASALLCTLAIAAADQRVERRWRVPGSPSQVELDELSSALRTVFDVAEVSADASAATIGVRAALPQINAVDWLLHDLEAPEHLRRRSPHQYRIAGDKLLAVRAVYLNPDSAQGRMLDIAAAVRAVTELPKVFSLTRPRVLLMRGAEAEEELAEWLVNELENARNQAPGYSGIHQFRVAAKDDSVRIFFADRKDNPDFAPVAKKLFATHRRAYYIPSGAALILRGTADRIAADEKLIGVR